MQKKTTVRYGFLFVKMTVTKVKVKRWNPGIGTACTGRDTGVWDKIEGMVFNLKEVYMKKPFGNNATIVIMKSQLCFLYWA